MAQMPELTIWDIEDISTRQDDLQTALRQRDELAAFIDNAPVGLYSVRPAGQLVFVNRTLATWLGSSPERIVATEIGRASCRERVCQSGWIEVVACSLKTKK